MVYLDNTEISKTAKKIILRMKKQEEMFCDVKSEYLKENDTAFCSKWGIDPN